MDSENEQIERMKGCISELIISIYDCCICGGDYDQGDSSEDCAKWLYSEGWRYSGSDFCQREGLMCPKCLNTPDKERVAYKGEFDG